MNFKIFENKTVGEQGSHQVGFCDGRFKHPYPH